MAQMKKLEVTLPRYAHNISDLACGLCGEDIKYRDLIQRYRWTRGDRRVWHYDCSNPKGRGVIVTEAKVHDESTYNNHGCRCPVCTEATRVTVAEARERRKQALAADPSLAVHGSPSTYQNWGCRCTACTTAHSEARKRWPSRVDR